MPAVEDAAPAVVDARGLGVTFGRGRRAVAALIDADLDCAPGEVVGVLGPNGSGKTTLFRVLVGDLAWTAGHVTVLGRPPGDPARTARIGYQPEGPLPFPRLSGRTFLRHLAALLGMPRRAAADRADELLDALDLAHAAPRPHATYSTGMAKRLALAGALLTEPDLLLLDEPTSGLDAQGSARVLEVLRARAAAGASVVLASHHLQEVESICDRVVVLVRGRVRRSGTLDDVLGGDASELAVTGLAPTARAAVEDAVVAAGGEVRGWRRSRRHLFDLFRELDAEVPPDARRDR